MKKLKFFGLGGQGVVTAAKIFSAAISLYDGKYAITVPAYGHERRGAPVNTSIITDNKEVLLNSFVYEPDIVLIMDEKMIDKNVDIAAGIHSDSILVLNTANEEMLNRYSQFDFKDIYYVDATEIAIKHIGVGIPNGSMLGALSATEIVNIESVEKAIKDKFKNKAGEDNAKAAREAYEKVKKI